MHKSQVQQPKQLGSVLITNLPTDIKSIYTSLIKRLFHSSPIPQQQISDIALISQSSSAILSCTVPNKAAAAVMKRRLHNSTICGRKWKVQCVPVSQITCSSTACLMQCTTVPACEKQLVERALSAVPGFLSLIDQDEVFALEKKDSTKNDHSHTSSERQHAQIDTDSLFIINEQSSNVNSNGTMEGNNTANKRQGHFLASFVNEGSALHARAVLSGRLIGTSGAHLFLSRRH